MVNGKNLTESVRPIEGKVRNLKLHPSSRQLLSVLLYSYEYTNERVMTWIKIL